MLTITTVTQRSMENGARKDRNEPGLNCRPEAEKPHTMSAGKDTSKRGELHIQSRGPTHRAGLRGLGDKNFPGVEPTVTE